MAFRSKKFALHGKNMSPDPLPHARDDRWLFVTRPTAATRWWRTCIPWQLFRFIVVNVKMLRLIARGHH